LSQQFDVFVLQLHSSVSKLNLFYFLLLALEYAKPSFGVILIEFLNLSLITSFSKRAYGRVQSLDIQLSFKR